MDDAEAGDAVWLALDRARAELLAAFEAKGEADRRYLRAVLAYDAAAAACRAAPGASLSDRIEPASDRRR